MIDNALFVDWDGNIILCCQSLREKGLLNVSYLDTTMEEIQSLREKQEICSWCKKNGLAISAEN